MLSRGGFRLRNDMFRYYRQDPRVPLVASRILRSMRGGERLVPVTVWVADDNDDVVDERSISHGNIAPEDIIEDYDNDTSSISDEDSEEEEIGYNNVYPDIYNDRQPIILQVVESDDRKVERP
jgi:hypothetical protein